MSDIELCYGISFKPKVAIAEFFWKMQRKTWYSILGLDAMPLSLKNLLLIGENSDFVVSELVAGSGQWVNHNLLTSLKQQLLWEKPDTIWNVHNTFKKAI